MASGPGSDKTLLERLNALKPSSMSLDSASQSVPASTIDTIERAKPPSREDALTARLKSLRSQSSGPQTPSASEPEVYQHSDNVGPQIAKPPAGDGSMNHGPVTSRPTSASPPPTAAAPRQAGGDDVDPLLHTDDQTLEELLADLDADQPWLDVVAAEEEERQRTEAEEHRRVLSLLDELGKEGPSTHPTPGRDDTTGSGAGGENSSDDDDDDSEGDAMAHETDNVLAQAVDEADWDKANKPPSPSPPPSPPPPARGTDSSSSSSLPGHDRATDAGPFVDLPAAPTALQGQPDVVKEGSEEDDEDDADFAATIVARMAALQVSPARSLPSAPTADPDELSLPAAPSFAPADRPPAFVSSSRRAAGYTDADQLTWCVVCLEDGTVRCLGCSSSDGGGGGGGGDVYCARCWREMHVGPAAGYDERGHRWEKFVGGGRGAAR